MKMMKSVCFNFCQRFPGIAVRGKCNEKERETIKNVWEQVRHNIDHATEATIWMNIYHTGKYYVEENPEITWLHSWATDLVKKHSG